MQVPHFYYRLFIVFSFSSFLGLLETSERLEYYHSCEHFIILSEILGSHCDKYEMALSWVVMLRNLIL
jgi:hypothetical protein